VTTDDPADWTHEAQSDLARIARDHEFLRVLAAAVAAQGLGNPITDEKLVASVAPQLEMDPALKGQLLSLASTFHAVNPGSVPELTLPVTETDTAVPVDYYYEGYDYQEVVYPTLTDDEHTIEQFLGVTPTVDTMTGRPLPASSSVSVSVLNGSGVTDQAADTGKALAALGFKIGTLGDSTPVGTPAQTFITYSSEAEEGAAEAVARSFSGLVVLARGPTTGGSDVTVTTGTDFTVAAPAAATTAPTTTTSVPPVSTADALTPPSPSVSPLEAWDPRACGTAAKKS
jgi:hypothetical protein